jgi:hypothetical protein
MYEHMTEALLRLELLKHNPELIAKLEADRHKEGEGYFRSLVGPGGSVRRNGSGILVLNPGRLVDLREPAGGHLIQRAPSPVRTEPSVPPHPKSPQPSDYSKLLVAESKRRAAWRPSAQWKGNHTDLLRWVVLNRRDQVALAASVMAAEELGIQRPAVKAWRGDEKAADKKLGWVFSNDLGEINVTLDQDCRGIAKTTAHECRHVWQFQRYPNLTSEQRERDADAYGGDFVERVFEKAVA